MQPFSADATIFFKKIKFFFAPENMKKTPSKVAPNQPPIFFQYCQPAQNQLKSHFLFHKNVSLRNNDFHLQMWKMFSILYGFVYLSLSHSDGQGSIRIKASSDKNCAILLQMKAVFPL